MSNYNSTLQSNNTDLQAILNTINELPNAGGEQATPVISVNSTNGLITATAGTKTSTHQLAFQPAKTITPSTASQIAVSSGYYTGGAVTVKGDSNLVAGNIKSGVNIFGVTGTYVGSGGTGDTSAEDGIIMKTISGAYINNRVTFICSSAFANCYSLTTVSFPVATSISDNAFTYCSRLTTVSFPKATSIGNSAFAYCSSLTTVSFPKVTRIGSNAFSKCSSLTKVSFPKDTIIGSNAFADCSKLTTVSFPVATSISNSAFTGCSGLTTVSFPKATSIGNSAFAYCRNLKSLYLTGSSVCKLSNSSAFTLTPIGGYSAFAGTYGSIYVPTSLLASYKAATNWTYFANRFVGI